MKNKIVLFDIDDTLIKSKAKIYVLDENNRVVKKLTPAQYNTYNKKDGEHFSYIDFNNEEILNSAKHTKLWDTLLKEYRNGTNIGIVTAREDKEMLLRYFIKNGLDINRYLMFPVGGKSEKYKGSIKNRKRQVIEHLSARGYKKFVLYDDDEENLKEVSKMEKRIGIKIEAIKV